MNWKNASTSTTGGGRSGTAGSSQQPVISISTNIRLLTTDDLLPLPPVTAGFALFAADLPPAAWLSHRSTPFQDVGRQGYSNPAQPSSDPHSGSFQLARQSPSRLPCLGLLENGKFLLRLPGALGYR
jgi:hypothetical protein